MTRLPASVRANVRRLKALLEQEIKESRVQAMDRAHLATRGDRPFAGCNPCEPSQAGAPSSLGVNQPPQARG
ncbi:MAG: hypothetical protein ACE5GS_05595 [Kiloniellaceae bacterium]